MGNIDIRFYRSIFVRRFPYFAAIAFLVSLTGLVVAYILPPVYRAEARIMVESPQISADLVRSTVPPEIVKQLQMIELQMMTRANLLALADRFNLYAGRPGLSDNDIVEDMRSRASVDQIRFDASRGGGGVTAFAVTFKAKDPVLASDVVNEFVNLIMQRNVRLRTDQASDTLQFFQQETERLGTLLNQVEGEILHFKNDNKDALPESLAFRRNQQMNLNERLLQLDREEASLRDSRAKLVQFFASTGRIASAAMTPAEQTLERLRQVMAEQRTIFSDSSPGIVALQSQISALEDQVRADRSSGGSGPNKKPSELDLQLADMDQRLTLIGQEKVAIAKSLATLTQSIAATPSNETALNGLERQYQNIQTQYNVATARLADASTGQRIELRSKGERLTLLEPATPPQRAIGPKRMAIAGGSFAGGIALGLGFIVLLEVLNKSIRRPVELIESLEIEPLATIPYIRTRGETQWGGTELIPATLRRALSLGVGHGTHSSRTR